MPKSEAKRQKKLARKRAKDKQRHKVISARNQMLASGRGRMLAASQGEILGCYRGDANEVVEVNGMIPVLVIRQGPSGLLALANFLVDFWCLGVKDCSYCLESPDVVNSIKKDMNERLGLIPIDPSVGRAMVELGVGFADSLGIAPHADYANAKLLWGDTPIGELPSDIEFGVNGKPLYIVGPYDDVFRQREILSLLEESVGQGNFNFTSSPSFISDSPISFQPDEDSDYFLD
jgi:hypothetical protein